MNTLNSRTRSPRSKKQKTAATKAKSPIKAKQYNRTEAIKVKSPKKKTKK
jgi:hypothetical protein